MRRLIPMLAILLVALLRTGPVLATPAPQLTLTPSTPIAGRPFVASVAMLTFFPNGFSDQPGSPAISVDGQVITGRLYSSCEFAACPPPFFYQHPVDMPALAAGSYEFIIVHPDWGTELARFTFSVAAREGVPMLGTTATFLCTLVLAAAGLIAVRRHVTPQ